MSSLSLEPCDILALFKFSNILQSRIALYGDNSWIVEQSVGVFFNKHVLDEKS